MKAKTLLLSGILSLGLFSCTKEDNEMVNPSPFSSDGVGIQKEPTDGDKITALNNSDENTVSNEELTEQNKFKIENGIPAGSYVISRFVQDGKSYSNIASISLVFQEGVVSANDGGKIYSGSYSFNKRDNVLQIRLEGSVEMNHISSDVWQMDMRLPEIKMIARHYEMVREMDLRLLKSFPTEIDAFPGVSDDGPISDASPTFTKPVIFDPAPALPPLTPDILNPVSSIINVPVVSPIPDETNPKTPNRPIVVDPGSIINVPIVSPFPDETKPKTPNRPIVVAGEAAPSDL